MNRNSKFSCAAAACVIGGIVAALFICGGVITVRESSTALDEPRLIRCRDLIDHGPGDNHHVLITDLSMLGDKAVIRTKRLTGIWENVCIPIVPAGEEQAAQVGLVLISSEATSRHALRELLAQREVQGLVGGFTASLSDEERMQLEAEFPATDFDQVQLVRHLERGAKPPTALSGFVCLAVGAVLMITCASAMVWAVRGMYPRRDPAGVSGRGNSAFAGGDVLWWKVNRVEGLDIQAGVAILRPDYVAFLPTAKAKNLGLGVTGMMAGAATGIHAISLDLFRTAPDIESALDALWRDDRPGFDAAVQLAVEQFGGQMWRQDQAIFARKKRPFGDGELVNIESGHTSLAGSVYQRAALDQLLAEWKPGEASLRSATILCAVLAIITSLAAAAAFGYWRADSLPWAAFMTWGGIASFLWLATAICYVKEARRKARLESADQRLSDS